MVVIKDPEGVGRLVTFNVRDIASAQPLRLEIEDPTPAANGQILLAKITDIAGSTHWTNSTILAMGLAGCFLGEAKQSLLGLPAPLAEFVNNLLQDANS